MKILIWPLIFLFTTPFTCSKQDQLQQACYRGKLSLKGICLNYVIEVVDGNIDKSLVEEKWVHPSTGKEYTNAFALESICSFPTTIQEGDEFNFYIPEIPPVQNCAQCQAYSAVPEKKISIEICNN